MHWIFLVIAGLFEISWAVGLKYTQGFTKILPSSITIICMITNIRYSIMSIHPIAIVAI